MRLGIMQPYFLPYLGYFSLIKHTDQFILFDTAQFIYHGWIERNRILKQSGSWQYIAVPLKKHSHLDSIQQIEISYDQPWQEKILAQLQHYKKAPYFRAATALLRQLFHVQYRNIAELDMQALVLVCDYIGIHHEIELFSRINCKIEPAQMPDEWALNICKAMGADEYWNPPGGIDFFDRSKYERAGIDLRFQKVDLMEYQQKGDPFEPGLSIIDVMMFCSPNEINQMLDHYTFL